MKDIVAAKIKQGRILRALSQQEVADKLQLSKQMISKYEKGDAMPSSTILIGLAKIYDVKVDYFFSSQVINLGEIHFRKKSKFATKKLNALKEDIKRKLSNYLEIESILQIDNRFKNPLQKIHLSDMTTVQSAVCKLRREWAIGLEPVHNIIQLLEDKEIKVIEIEEQENAFDGLATVVNEHYPAIVVNKNFTVERKRFTLLHELGHLLLEVPDCDTKSQENSCNLFAGEFLFPQASVLHEFGLKRDTIAIQELVEMQKKYGISIKAILHRLLHSQVISPTKHAAFFKKLNYNPAFKKEIEQERFQTPEISNRYRQLVYRAYSQELISTSKAASLLHININQVLTNDLV